MDGGPTRSRITSWEIALGHHVEGLLAVFPRGFDQAVVTALAYELGQGFEAPTLRTGAERPDLWAAAITTAIKGLFLEEDVAAVTEFLAVGLDREFDPPRRIGPRHAPDPEPSRRWPREACFGPLGKPPPKVVPAPADSARNTWRAAGGHLPAPQKNLN